MSDPAYVIPGDGSIRIVPESSLFCKKCGMILPDCACSVAHHAAECPFARAVRCPVAIECEPHGRDVCPICDPCTCEKKT